ncbi:hypothetical protein F2Q68_00012320 [Brassica cretica]|uniref:Uncharacterized protein n=1 Tax=Brassica cretica TaxID=69181 RepID=A0A8S9KYD1_BRACR|nr:hypothetical protein F2Q68_00012320 [Brassica cretica]
MAEERERIRCGHLGHKEKRCLLPAVDSNVETRSTHEDLSAEEPQPEMGKILAQSTVASDQLVSEAENLESQVNVEPKHLSTPVNNPTHSKTNLVSMDNSLVPPHSHAHDISPTNQIAHIVQDDGEGSMSEATTNLNMSRDGRPIKPLQKFQDMKWKTVRGRGKRARRGRGNHLPSS